KLSNDCAGEYAPMNLPVTRRSLLASGVAALACGPVFAATRKLDIALVNGRVWTGTRGGRSDAVGIAGGRIAAIGNAAVKAATGPGTKVIDLDGGFVMPAFIDCHTHFLRGANFLL